jgi:hypothetical protein
VEISKPGNRFVRKTRLPARFADYDVYLKWMCIAKIAFEFALHYFKLVTCIYCVQYGTLLMTTLMYDMVTWWFVL